MISDTESEGGAEIEGVLDPETDSTASRDSDQPVVRRQNYQRITTQPPNLMDEFSSDEEYEPPLDLGGYVNEEGDFINPDDGQPIEEAEAAEPAEAPRTLRRRRVFRVVVPREYGLMIRVPQPQPAPYQEQPDENLDPQELPGEPVVNQEAQEPLALLEGGEGNPPLVPAIQAVIVGDPPPLPSPPTTSRRARAAQESAVITLDTPSPPKKRKRGSANTSLKNPSPESKAPNLDEEDDGMTCPICLDSWEMSGEHRLVSLRCGHLFGESCIRRWLNESQRQSSVKVCPQCKTKATFRDIRHLYAKRIQMLDTDIKEQLEAERRRTQELTTELATSKLCHALASEKLLALQANYDRLKELVRAGGGRGAFASDAAGSGLQKSVHQLATHRLYMEKNFEITREPGCRVLLYSAKHSMLVASQKSAQNLFPGYGVRFIDPPSFKPLHFLHTSALLVRDVAFSESQHLLTVASREPKIKLFDTRSRLCSSMFTAHDKMLWSCALDRNEREHFLYGGDLRGGVYIYDLRFPETILCEFQANDNFSPVIHIVTVPPNKTFTSGGFLVCQLTALTFYEYAAASDTAVPTRLNVEGPFLSMQYDAVLDTLLISARSNPNSPQSRFILGQLDKMDNTPVLKVKATIYGSKATPIMTRPTQLGVEDNTLVVGYLQDTKQLMMHDVRREERVQTMPVNEVIYDICPVATQAGSYLAALTDNKCRVYKVNSSKR